MGYAAASHPAAKSKPSLNKRVAFPMQSSDTAVSTKVQTSAAGLPMPFARVKQQPPPPVRSVPATEAPPMLPPPNRPPPPMAAVLTPAHHIEEPTLEPIIDLDVSHDLTLQTLHTILKSVIGLDATKSEEIEKRLGVLSTMWLDNRLDSKLQFRLAQISECKLRESHITPDLSLSDLLSPDGLTISQFLLPHRYYEWKARRSY